MLLIIVLCALLASVPAVIAAIKVEDPVIVGGAIAVAAVVVVLGAVWQDRYKQAAARRDAARLVVQDGCLVLAGGRLPRVNQIHDPLALGVHRAITLAGDSTAPAYVPRDQDAALRECLAGAGFVLLVGHSTSGKSRAAFEAMQEVLPEHVLIVPHDQGSLPAAIDHAAQGRRSVLWLNDLERYLRPGGLTRDQITRLVSGTGHHRVVLATLRSSQRIEMLRGPTASGDAAQLSARQVREVLDQAHEVHLDRRFSPGELARARALTGDLRIDAALQHADEYGIAEYLASGPALQRAYTDAWDGPNPRGASLVAAAIDCFHAGFTKPLPRKMLEELHERYLAERGGRLLLPESLEAAWEWATSPMPGTTSALLTLTRDGGSVTVFDYLVDVKQRAEGPGFRISAGLAATALAYASEPDALSIATILDQTDMAVVLLDRFGNALRWNPFAEQTFGLSMMGVVPAFLAAPTIPEGLAAAEILAQVVSTGLLWEGSLDVNGIKVRTQALPLTGPAGTVTSVVLLTRSAPVLLDEVATRLSTAVGLEESLRAVTEILVPRLADRCLIEVDSRRASVPVGWPPDESVQLDDPVWCEQLGLQSVIRVSLRARGVDLGYIFLGSTIRSFGTADRELVESIADRLALVADSALLLEHQQHTARELVIQMLPRVLPSLDGLETAMRYFPGDAAQFGSDWWDVIPLSAGRVGIVVGDVEGRGPQAVALMGQLRAVLRALAQADLPPAEILTYMDGWIRAMAILDSPPIVTCQYLVYDAWARGLTFTNAAHPPPLLVVDGHAAELSIANLDTPLGLQGTVYEAETYILPPGATLLLYTDGLVNRSAVSASDGMEMLRRAVSSAASDTIESLADAAALAVPGKISDDMVILVLRTTEIELDVEECTFPAKPVMASLAVDMTSAACVGWEVPEAQAQIACRLVNELVSNAIQHAVTGPRLHDAEFTLRIRRGEASIWIDVFDQDLRLPRTSDSSEGGLRLVDQLAKRWGARPTREGKSVWFELGLDPSDDAD